MKIFILDTVEKQLKDVEGKTLYGISSKGTSVITSVEPRDGLEEVGVFIPGEEDYCGRSNSFRLVDGKLTCFSSIIGSHESWDVEIIRYETDFNKRLVGVVDTSTVKGSTVAVFGLGSGGGAIVLDLVRSGVTNIIAVDFDTVSISNICRSVYDLTDIGKKKTDAIFEKIMRINPNVKVKLYDQNILDMSDETLTDIIEQSDLIIEGTDNGKAKVELNGMARHLKPVIYPGTYEYGKGGDILITAPGLPCFECVFNTSENDENEENLQGWDYTTGEPKPMPALIADIQVVVARTVKLALAILSTGGEESFFEKVTEPGCTLLLIGNEKDYYIFERPFQEVWAETSINPECTCQTLR